MPGNSLQLGNILGRGKPLSLPASARERHLYVCGGTGVGKSKFLEHCIRQDILNWRDSKCGLLLLDPHGLVYENTMAWLTRHGLKRPIIPIDLRRDDWIISYNLLRKRKDADPSVIVSGFIRALAHVWGESGTDSTPLFARWAGAILNTLYQNGYTVADVVHLLARKDIQRAMIAKVQDQMIQYTWRTVERQPKDFEQQIMSTLNRFNRLVGPQVMRATFGQPDVSLDLQSSLEKGDIILVNLSTEGGQIDEEDADTFATLLLTDLWSAAKARGKRERDKMRPFYVYIDECQKFITPTIADNLDQARGFGLHLTLANQYPKRLINSGPHGQLMYDSIMANAGNKIVFRLEHPEDAKSLGEWLFMNTFDTDQVKLKLLSTKVMRYRKEIRESHSTGTSMTHTTGSGQGGGRFQGQSTGEGESETKNFGGEESTDPFSSAEGWNSCVTDSSGESASWSENESTAIGQSAGVTRSIIDVPELGKEVSSIQYRTIDEQIFRAMQTLFDQQDRHFAIRFHGGPKAPLFVKTPTVVPSGTKQERVEKYRKQLLGKLPFAMPLADAVTRLDAREKKLLADVVDIETVDEPTSAGRPLK